MSTGAEGSLNFDSREVIYMIFSPLYRYFSAVSVTEISSQAATYRELLATAAPSAVNWHRGHGYPWTAAFLLRIRVAAAEWPWSALKWLWLRKTALFAGAAGTKFYLGGTILENYVQKLPRRVSNVKKLLRRVRIVKKLPRRVRNVKLVDLGGYKELGSLRKSWRRFHCVSAWR